MANSGADRDLGTALVGEAGIARRAAGRAGLADRLERTERFAGLAVGRTRGELADFPLLLFAACFEVFPADFRLVPAFDLVVARIFAA